MGIVATVSAAAGATSQYVQIDDGAEIASLVVNVGAGITGFAKVQISNDPKIIGNNPLIVAGPSQAPGVTRWVDHEILNNITANVASNIEYLPQWIRLDCTNVLSGTVSLGVRTRTKK
jgi:hypothetical protein